MKSMIGIKKQKSYWKISKNLVTNLNFIRHIYKGGYASYAGRSKNI